MHEASICQSILKTIETELDDNDLANVREIHLKVGVLSSIEPEVLKFIFKIIIVDTPFQNSELYVDMVEVMAKCGNCGQTFKVEKYKFICPRCGEPASNVTEGTELLIHKIILEEPDYAQVNQ